MVLAVDACGLCNGLLIVAALPALARWRCEVWGGLVVGVVVWCVVVCGGLVVS